MAKTCPACGSTKIIAFGWQIAKKKKIPKYRCNKCYRYFVHPKYSGLKGAKIKASVVVDAPDADE